MNKVMTISAIISGIIHCGFFLVYEIGYKAPEIAPVEIHEDVALVDEATPPSPVSTKPGTEELQEEESLLPDALVSTGLDEPPPAIITSDILTQYSIPYARYLKSPDSILTVGIPSGAQRNAAKKAKECVVFSIEQLDCVPQLRKGARPSYPRQMLAAHIEGIVRMLVLLDITGRVTVRKVLEANRIEFEQSAIEAAERFVYDPPTKNGRPVNTEFVLPIKFEIE